MCPQNALSEIQKENDSLWSRYENLIWLFEQPHTSTKCYYPWRCCCRSCLLLDMELVSTNLKKCRKRLLEELSKLPPPKVDVVEACVPLLPTKEEEEQLDDSPPNTLEEEVEQEKSSCEPHLSCMPQSSQVRHFYTLFDPPYFFLPPSIDEVNKENEDVVDDALFVGTSPQNFSFFNFEETYEGVQRESPKFWSQHSFQWEFRSIFFVCNQSWRSYYSSYGSFHKKIKCCVLVGGLMFLCFAFDIDDDELWVFDPGIARTKLEDKLFSRRGE